MFALGLVCWLFNRNLAAAEKMLREKFATKNMIGVMSFGEYDGKITDSKKIAVLTMKSA